MSLRHRMIANRCRIATEMCTVKTVSALGLNRQDVTYRIIYSPRYQVKCGNDVPNMRPNKTENLSACKVTLVHKIADIYAPCLWC
jgi:hypothetical protein